jgi:hypothetical protein
MIIFSRCVQLGNQIFQYLFMRYISKKNETIILINMEEIFKLFKKIHAFNIHSKNQIIKKIISKFDYYLQKLSENKIIVNISENSEEINGCKMKNGTVKNQDGKIGFIKYVEGSNYQSSLITNNSVIHKMKINKKHLVESENFLKTLPNNCIKIFVHIRLGDYKDFEVLGKKDLTLPIKYYRYCIEYFYKTYKDPYFILISDQPKIAENIFKEIENKKVSYNSQYVDFALMTKCDAAILSCSSFSWFGAYFMSLNSTSKPKIFAPEYWLGFKSGIWYPKEIKSPIFEYVNISNLDKIY